LEEQVTNDERELIEALHRYQSLDELWLAQTETARRTGAAREAALSEFMVLSRRRSQQVLR
jgi:hypothetical protein